MTPNEHPQRLLAFLDGELSPEEAARVEAHVGACEHCARELTAHRQLHANLVAAAPTPVRGDLWTDLEPRRAGDGVKGIPRVAWASYLLVALLGLGAGGWAGWSMGEDLGEEASPELLAETSLYDLPEEGLAREYLEAASSEVDEEGVQ